MGVCFILSSSHIQELTLRGVYRVTTFIGAITLLCFLETRNLPQRIITSVIWLLVVAVFIWVVQFNQKSRFGQDLEKEDEDSEKLDDDCCHYSSSTVDTEKGVSFNFPEMKMFRRLRVRSQNSLQSECSKSVSERSDLTMV